MGTAVRGAIITVANSSSRSMMAVRWDGATGSNDAFGAADGLGARDGGCGTDGVVCGGAGFPAVGTVGVISGSS